MKPRVPVKDRPGLYRDANSGAIVNMDGDALIEHRKKVSEAKKKKLEERQKEEEINRLKKDVAEIKVFLQHILEKLNNGNN